MKYLYAGRVGADMDETTDKPTFLGFVRERTESGAGVHTEEHCSYAGSDERHTRQSQLL